MYQCGILACVHADENLRGILNHMRKAHSLAGGLFIGCLLGCSTKFSTVHSLRTHVLTRHRLDWDRAGEPQGRNPVVPSPECTNAEPLQEIPTTSEAGGSRDRDNRTKTAIATYERMMHSTSKLLPSLYLRMQYKYNIPRSVSRLIHDEYVHTMRMLRAGWSRALCEYASVAPSTKDPHLITMMSSNEIDHILRTSTLREDSQLQALGWLRPVEVDLKVENLGLVLTNNPLNEVEIDADDVEALPGIDELTESDEEGEIPDPGHPIAVVPEAEDVDGSKEVYHYVPLLETLKNYLKHDDVANEILRGGSEHQGDGTYTDFSSGRIFSRTPRFFYDPHHLRIALYTDEVTVTNPLATHSKKHKLAVVYFVVNNVRPQYLSSLKSIHLVLICRWTLVKKYSYAVVLKRLFNDLAVLEETGIEILTSAGRLLHFYGSLAVISADNLSAHALGGFRCCFSSGKICRFCLTDFEQRTVVRSNADCTLRTEESVELQANLVGTDPLLRTVFGIQSRSCLYDLPGYNPLRFLPPDVMHDILECFMPIHVQQLILALHSSKQVTFPTFRKAYKEFKHHKGDAANKHPGLAEDWMNKKTRKIGGTAAEKWTIFRLMPFILHNHVDKDNEHWQLFKLALKISEIILAVRVSSDMLTELATLIKDHHEQWVLLYPNIFPAKFHFLVHYPKLMQEFGPLRLLWCMRFESFHQIIKGIIVRSRNFINVSKTATERFQKRRCLEHADSCGLPPAIELHGSEKILLFQEVKPSSVRQCVGELLGCTGNASLISVKHISLLGHPVFVGSYVIINLHNNVLPLFFKILHIFVLDDSVALYGCMVGTDHYDEHLQAYALVPTNEDDFDSDNHVAIGPRNILSPQSLNAYDIRGQLYIRYKFRPLAK